MSRRKDNKGRVLRTGESQRKDLIYQYRYTDALGNRKCIYASDLKTLREKEDEQKHEKIREDLRRSPGNTETRKCRRTCNIGHLRRNTKQKRSDQNMIKILFLCHGIM